MKKAELIDVVAANTGMTKKDAGKALDAVLDGIAGCLNAGDRIALNGFGIFEAKVRKARTARNPATQQVITVPQTTVPSFKPAAALKESVAKGGK